MSTFGLFEAYGVEIEYMIVNKGSFAIEAIADQLFYGQILNHSGYYNNREIAWSNELVNHVVELKTSEPIADFTHADELFHKNILEVNGIFSAKNARLMPGGCHPFMNPGVETMLWQNDNAEIYEAYNRMFDCKAHGWANLQSTHLNLSFKGDKEFARLHTAIRLLLPLLPALAASSPFIDGKYQGIMDNRLVNYKNNQKKIPIITGRVIPELLMSEEEYHQQIFMPIEKELTKHELNEVLDYHYVNSRGAIARFDRGSIEIRLLDCQESPKADIAYLLLIVEILKALVGEETSSFKSQQLALDPLVAIYELAVNKASAAYIEDTAYLQALGLTSEKAFARDIWKQLMLKFKDRIPETYHKVFQVYVEHGTLAERMVGEGLRNPDKEQIRIVCEKLSTCLSTNTLYV